MGMIVRFPLGRTHFRAIRNGNDWGRFLRRFEIDSIFEKCVKREFSEALELGCGSGLHSRHVASYCKHLTATEYDEGKLCAEGSENLTFSVADAQNLSRFSDSSLDLVFSSNLLEHLPKVDDCLKECRRVIKNDGLIVHSLPSCTWMVCRLALFYPSLARAAVRKLFRRGKTSAPEGDDNDKQRLDDNLAPLNSSDSVLRKLRPNPHGISPTHWQEFKRWKEARWLKMFHRNELEVVRIVRLPFYFGHGYTFRPLLRLGNYAGLSASTAYVMRKR